MTVASVENILKESRSSIVDLLKTNGAMSVEQLAQELAVSKVCVRRHLSLLESDGLISYVEERHERGRPRFIYKLTDKARCFFPQNYDEFARDLLLQIQRQFGDEGLENVIAARTNELIERIKKDLDGTSFDESVKILTKTINSNGYLADARRLKDGSYRLRHRNCPTENVAVQYPIVCEEEMRVYQETLGCEVVRECRIVDGARMCEFRIMPSALTQITSRKSSD
ncbi:MAG: DeoR family transcriptional regulator [Acidobacteria bacterium]|nr:DeoR family transcriptional regulator [Acidobacteriota bacterium]